MRIWKYFVMILIALFAVMVTNFAQASTISKYANNSIYTYSTSVDSQSMEAVLGYYCQTVSPTTKCGVYQYEITQAQLRANQLINIMSSYSAQDKKVVLEWLLQRISRAFYNAPDTNTKVISAFYYTYFSQQSTASADDLASLLFDNWSTPRYTQPIQTNTYSNQNSYQNSNSSWDIVNVRSTNKYTRVNSNNKDISLTDYLRTIWVSVRANVSNSRSSNNYRMMAEFSWRSQKYYGNFTRNGTWDFSFWRQFSDERSVTFTLLSWNREIDSVTYSIDIEDYRYDNRRNHSRDYNDGRRYDDRNTRRYDDCDEYWRYDSRYCDEYWRDDYYRDDDRNTDLLVKHVWYTYGRRSNDLVIELTTTVRNNSRYEAELEELYYDIEINNRRVRENSDYKIYHKRTQCDDSNNRSSASQDIEIEAYDECEITVEVIFDSDLYRSDVEVEVEIDSRDDDNNSNNSKRVAFSVR